MDDSKYKICLELYKTQTERFKDTRQIQWKINIAFWTFILISGAFLYGKYQVSFCEGVFIFLSFATLHFLWCLFIQKSLERDKFLTEKYREHLDEFLGEERKLAPSITFKIRWLVLQVSVTILFLLFSLYFLNKSTVTEKTGPTLQFR